MFARRMLMYLLIALLAGFAVSCSRGKEKDALKTKNDLAARVGNFRISEQEMRERFEALPEQQLKDFQGPEGQAKFVDRLIEQHLLYQAALDEKVDKNEEIKNRIKWLTMSLIVGEYYNKKIADKIQIEDSEIEAYYKAHPEEFYQAPVMRAQYAFTTDSLKAVAWKKRLANGENFSRIAKEESEDETTAKVNGDLGYFNPGSYIKSIGYSDVFSKTVEKLEPNEISPVIHFEKGFAVVRVTEKNPSRSRTLDEVRKSISNTLRAQKAEAEYRKVVERLGKKYPSENYIKERLDRTTRTPEELWELAQIEQDAQKRVQYYRDLVSRYPSHKNAPQALFMIGFVYSEELQDLQSARRTFEELIKKYPQSDMVETAKWMIENIQTGHSKIESLESVQKQVEEEKAQKAGGAK
jgi:parvulin-like peptidyl-prolyl isomerase